MKKLINQIATVIVLAVFMLGSFSVVGQSNPKNPYDYVGKIHNEVLSNYRGKFEHQSVKESYTTMISLVNSNNLAKKHGIVEKFDNKILNMLENGAYHVKNQYVNLISNLKISKNAKLELLSLKKFILETTLKNNIGFKEFYKHMTDTENRILKMKLNSYEKKIILGSYSVARYSYYFWDGKLNSSSETSKKRGFWGTVFVIGGDVAGWFGTGSISGAGAASELVGDAVDQK